LSRRFFFPFPPPPPNVKQALFLVEVPLLLEFGPLWGEVMRSPPFRWLLSFSLGRGPSPSPFLQEFVSSPFFFFFFAKSHPCFLVLSPFGCGPFPPRGVCPLMTTYFFQNYGLAPFPSFKRTAFFANTGLFFLLSTSAAPPFSPSLLSRMGRVPVPSFFLLMRFSDVFSLLYGAGLLYFPPPWKMKHTLFAYYCF